MISVFAALWGALYVMFWYQRSGCFALFDRLCNDAPIAWLERLVSLWWVKDYQELVAAVIALVAAIVVGRPVYIQLREARRQSSASAIPNIKGVALELEEYLAHLEKIRPAVFRLSSLLQSYDTENYHRLFEFWPKEVSAVVDRLFELIEALERSSTRGYAVDYLLEQRGIRLTTTLRDELMLLNTTFRHSTSGPDAEHGEDDMSEMANAARDRVGETWSLWVIWRVDYILAVRKRVAEAWSKVRKLEDEALGTASK